MSALDVVFSPVLIQFDLRLVRNDQATSVSAGLVVNVHGEVGHLTGQEEVLRHGHLHVRHLATDQADLLLEGNDDVELRVVDDRAHWANVNALAVAHFALAPLVVEELRADGHELGLEEVAQLAAELGPALREVEGLRQICRNLETERNGAVSSRADVVLEHDHLIQLPDATLPNVRIPLSFVTVVDLFARVNQLKLELDAVGRDRLVRVNVDRTNYRMVGIEGARVTLEANRHGCSIKF